jgi:hypothetical protein
MVCPLSKTYYSDLLSYYEDMKNFAGSWTWGLGERHAKSAGLTRINVYYQVVAR